MCLARVPDAADLCEKSEIMGRYDRNRIYISAGQQERIRSYRVFIGGAGIGSLVAECALRLGFERITVVDMDSAEAIGDRLRAINPDAEIVVKNTAVTHDNVRELIDGCDAAVNALDFTTDIPLEFDDVCLGRGIPVLHPYNIGFSSCVMVLTPSSPTLRELLPDGASPAGFEKRAVEHVIRHFGPHPVEIRGGGRCPSASPAVRSLEHARRDVH